MAQTVRAILSGVVWTISLIFLLVGIGCLKARSQTLCGVSQSGSPVWAAEGQAIVKLREGVDAAALNKVLGRRGARLVKRLAQEPWVLHSHPARLQQELRELASAGVLESAEPNYLAQACFAPADPLFRRYQWNLAAWTAVPGTGIVQRGIQAELAWDVATGRGVVVAVLDTGVAFANAGKFRRAPDLARTRFVQGYNFSAGNPYPFDDEGHGTHVAGTIAASTNDGLGCAGVAFDAAIMPVKVLDKQGWGTYSSIAAGIRWAADNGADIINLSLAGPADSAALHEAVQYAASRGVLIVAAAGNDGAGVCGYPARYPECIAVGATTVTGERAFYSNFGRDVDLAAPGGDNSTDVDCNGAPDGILQMTFRKNPKKFAFYLYSGTSMAAPHVSGAAALVWSARPELSASEVRRALETTALPLDGPGGLGAGLVDAWAAVQSVL